jgi:hypothetical protein
MAARYDNAVPPLLHSANSQQGINRLQLLSLLPVSIAAVFNVGYQYLTVLANTPDVDTDNLRGRIADFLGASHQDPGFYDLMAAGLAHMLPILFGRRSVMWYLACHLPSLSARVYSVVKAKPFSVPRYLASP